MSATRRFSLMKIVGSVQSLPSLWGRPPRGKFARSLRCMVVMAAFLGSTLPATADEYTPDEIVTTVTNAITNNYDQLKTIEATIHTVIETHVEMMGSTPESEIPENTRTELLAQEAAQETSSDSRESPPPPAVISEWTHEVFLRGQERRFVYRRADGQLAEIMVFSKRAFPQADEEHGVWQFYVPRMRQLTILRTQEMPSRFPIDPREYCVSEHFNEGPIEQLRINNILEAAFVERKDGTTVAKIITHGPRSPVTYEFDSTANFLPTLATYSWDDGSLKMSLQMSYQDLLDGKAKFLKKAVRKFFAQGVADSPESDKHRQVLTYSVVQVVANQELDDKLFLQIHPPKNVYVSSSIPSLMNREQPESRATVGLFEFSVMSASLLFVAALVFTRLKRRLQARHAA